jgi:acyl carrier protein
MSESEIRRTILNMFNSKEILKKIDSNQDFFDVGASSLTIVDMQIQVEEALKINVPTAKLMGVPTINGWVSAYTECR